jgi:hypothetical protein
VWTSRCRHRHRSQANDPDDEGHEQRATHPPDLLP